MVALSLIIVPLHLIAATFAAPTAKNEIAGGKACPTGFTPCATIPGCHPEHLHCDKNEITKFSSVFGKRAEEVADDEDYYCDEDIMGLDSTGLCYPNPLDFPGFSGTHII